MKRSNLNNGSKGKLNSRAQGKSSKISPSDKPDKKIAANPEQAKCKPLTGKVFYLDLPSNVFSENLEKDIKEFGGTVEGFLSKDISYLISNKKEAKFARAFRPFSPEASPESAQNTGNSSPHPNSKRGSLDGNLHKTADSVRISRGKSLVEKVIKEQEIIPSNSVLSNALSWGVKVIHINDIKCYIEQKKKECDVGQKPVPAVKEVGKGCNRQKAKTGRLKKPFVKVEDRSRHYRPFYLQLSAFPVINYSIAKMCSPFEVDKKVSSAQKQNQATLRNKPNTERESENQLLLNYKEKKKKGYCECCIKKYEDLQSHVESEQHRIFAQSAHYQVIDDMISKYVNEFVDRTNDQNKRRKCSTGERIPVETVLEKEQIQERLNKMCHLQEELSCANVPISPIQIFRTDDQPPEALNSCLQTPSLFSETAGSPSFHHTSCGIETVKEAENCKTEKSNQTDGMFAISNCVKLMSQKKSNQGSKDIVPKDQSDAANSERKSLLIDKSLMVQEGEMHLFNASSEPRDALNSFLQTPSLVSETAGSPSFHHTSCTIDTVKEAENCKTEKSDQTDRMFAISNCVKLMSQKKSNPGSKDNGPKDQSDAANSERKALLIDQSLMVQEGEMHPCNASSEVQVNTFKDTRKKIPKPVGRLSLRKRKMNSLLSFPKKCCKSENLNSVASKISDFKVDPTHLEVSPMHVEKLKLVPVVCKLPESLVMENNCLKEFITVHSMGQAQQMYLGKAAPLIFPVRCSKTSGLGQMVGNIPNCFVFDNCHSEKNCTVPKEELLQKSPCKDALANSTPKELKISNLNDAVIHNVNVSEMESHCLKEKCRDHEESYVGRNSNIKHASLIFPGKDFTTLHSVPKENRKVKEHYANHDLVNTLHTSPVKDDSFSWPSDYPKTHTDSVVSTITNSCGVEDDKMKDNCVVLELTHNKPNSTVNNVSFLFGAKDLETSQQVIGSFPSSCELKSDHMNDDFTVHEMEQDLQHSPININHLSITANNLKTPAFDPVIGIYSDISVLRNPHLKDNVTHEAEFVPQTTSLNAPCISRIKDVQTSNIDPAFVDFPSIDSMVSRGTSSFGVEDYQIKENCALLGSVQNQNNSPLKDFLFTTKDLETSHSAVVCFPSSCELESNQMNEDFSLVEMVQGTQYSPLINTSLISSAHDLNTPQIVPVSNFSNKSLLKDSHLIENCTTDEVECVVEGSSVNVSCSSLGKDSTSNIEPLVEDHPKSVSVDSRITNSFAVEVYKMKGKCALFESVPNQHSPVKKVSLLFTPKDLEPSNQVIASVPRRQSNQMNDNFPVAGMGQDPQRSPINNGSFISSSNDLKMQNDDPVADNCSSNSVLNNSHLMENCTTPAAGQVLQNSPILANDLKTSAIDSEVGDVKGFIMENSQLKENCTASKMGRISHGTTKKSTSYIFPANDLKTSDFDSSFTSSPNNFVFANHHLNANCNIHEEEQAPHSSPIEENVFCFPAKNVPTPNFEQVVGRIPNNFRLENFHLNGKSTVFVENILQNSVRKDICVFPTNNFKKSYIDPAVSEIPKSFRMENHMFKKADAGYELGQILQNSPSKDCLLPLPENNNEIPDFHHLVHKMYNSIELGNSHLKENCKFHETEPLLHRSPPTDILPGGKLKRKVKVPFARNKRSSRRRSIHLCADLANDITVQHEEYTAKGSSLEHYLEMFQTSDTQSDFLGFTNSSGKEHPFSSEHIWEQQSSNTPTESLLSLFQTSETHSEFLGFTSFSGKEGTPLQRDYWEEKPTSSSLDVLLELFQSSEARSDFIGFTSYSEGESKRYTNGYCKEKTADAQTESLVELFQTSEPHSDSMGFTSSSGQEGSCCLKHYEDQSSEPPWSLL
ncbi:protein DBF4 homolog A isoform X2 [Ambystoma mexicanum]|uniref:protein DBF4 homolog A isoform X2 n=1 Tax=Ambystoma mexicanum TaxID=8296 RepID=UPI0037E72164